MDEKSAIPGVAVMLPDGTPLSLTDLPFPAVVYFYPKDDTSGCTQEAQEFSALGDEFAAAGVSVLGVSKDSPKSHAKFAAKHGLSVMLASDEDGSACVAFGVWKEKSMYGRTYMGIERSTFLFGADGTLARSWAKVRVPGHVEAVLAAAKAL
jgi:peroxiredoxin Q/BCP